MLRLLLSFALALSASAADWSRLKPTGYVSDFAGVIDPASLKTIDSYLAALEQSSGAQVAIVTIPSLEGDVVEDVANHLYRQFGVGVKGKNEGALFLLAIKERKSRLEVGYGLEPIVPDAVAGDILRAMRPALRAGNYGPALIEAARTLGDRIASGKNIIVSTPLPPRRLADPPFDISLVQIAIIIGVLILLSFLNGGRRRRSRYYYGGGGFGGASSSGGSSWGGFGGGDSGGGGSSSDW